MAGTNDLASMVPGFEFLQGLFKNAGAAGPACKAAFAIAKSASTTTSARSSRATSPAGKAAGVSLAMPQMPGHAGQSVGLPTAARQTSSLGKSPSLKPSTSTRSQCCRRDNR